MKVFLILTVLISAFLRPGSGEVRRIKLAPTNETTSLDLVGGSHILMEYDSGEIIYENQADDKHYPASMTKMMGMLLVLEEIEKGNLSWISEVVGTEEASSMGGTQIFLAANERMSVEDLFKSVAINSANDAIVALGSKVAGDHKSFVDMMNKRAGELGMKNTHFVNATGFDHVEHYTSARDMALVARELLGFNEDILRFTRLKESYIRTDSDNPFWLVNTNRLLGNYDGLDGLKTGFTSMAGYNLTATAMRDGVRLISVTMKAPTIKDRSKDTVALLNYGFSRLERLPLYTTDDALTSFSFKNAKTKDTKLYPLKDINPVYQKGVNKADLEASVKLFKTEAPLKQNEVVGELIIKNKNGEIKSYPVIVKEDVDSMNFLDYLLKSIKNFFC